jgi:hypothetical protein
VNFGLMNGGVGYCMRLDCPVHAKVMGSLKVCEAVKVDAKMDCSDQQLFPR